MARAYDSAGTADVFHKKQNKVTLRRWFSWAHAMKEFLPCWHSLLLCLMYMGLRDGMFTKDDLPIVAAVQKKYRTGEVRHTAADGPGDANGEKDPY
eukprot:13799962-Heterocapsa_arctica.AAC.1